jgi:hypothetical protein
MIKEMIKDKFIVSEKSSPNGTLLVITDSEIVGKKFTEGKKQLDLTLKFYLGEEKSLEEAKELMRRAYVLHLTGVRAVLLGVELDLVDDTRVLVIKKIPHAEVVVER